MANLQDYSILFLILLISTIILRAILNKTRTKTRLPPSPLALPIIGHLHLLTPIRHQAFHKLSIHYGPLMHLFLGSTPCVIVSSPEMAKEIFKTHETSFLNRPRTVANDFLTYGSSDLVMAPYGPYWKFIKKVCMSELLSGKTLAQFHPIRCEEIKWLLQLILKKAEAGDSIDIGQEIMRTLNNVITRMTMGQRCSENEDEASKVTKMVQDMNRLTGLSNWADFIWFCKNLDLQGFGKRLKEARGRFDAIIEKVIRDHEEGKRKKEEMGDDAGNTTKDVVDILLDVAEDENSEMRLTRENIKGFILNMFGAATETSAITTEWALAELLHHPKVMEKARQEIDSVVGKDRVVEESDIDSLPYLQAIVKETLRLHPAAPLITRESIEDCTINGYKIPANTRIFINIWAIGRDPKSWENPLEFRPERFMCEEGNGMSQLDVRGQHFHYLPFGSGRRMCPGISLALMVVQTILASMIQCFEWKVGDGKNNATNMDEGAGGTLRKAHCLVCVPVARLNPFPQI
ncbi:hypothetical protein L1049_009230 [Liquidambar formosana]|uniref:Flavone synthase II n=1 Tax=Liquidambar formosana TaxID=63359 RepID=A0AAP0SB19_LIQFO